MVATFHDWFTYEFSLEALEDGELDDYLEDRDLDDYDWRKIMSYLIEHKDDDSLVKKENGWSLTSDHEYHVGHIVIGFLDKCVLPFLPEDSLEPDGLEEAVVEVEFKLTGSDIDLEVDYSDATADWWHQGECEEEHVKPFKEYIRDIIDGGYEEDGYIDDIQLEYTWAGIADLNQWRFLGDNYQTFLEDQSNSSDLSDLSESPP